MSASEPRTSIRRWPVLAAVVPTLVALGAAGLALATGSVASAVAGAGVLGLTAGALLAWSASRSASEPARDATGREQVLRAVVDGAPMAIVLHADAGLIRFTNAAARDLFFEGRAVEGRNFLSLLEGAPAPLREALVADGDGLFTVQQADLVDTYHLARRTFDLDGEPHTLLMVKHLTQELSRQEVDVWKKAIRVMSHELNNSLAPIASLVHSARLLAQRPDPAAGLERVFAVIEERTRHLHGFLEAYGRLARLPRPRPAPVRWGPFLEGIRALFPDVTWAPLPEAPGHFDAGQLEQVVINLVRNAVEAGGPVGSVSVEVAAEDDGFLLRVHDRGPGLSPEVLQSALLPFYSTKEKGSGLGLALCKEVVEAHGGRLRLANREGGGATATVWLPAPRSARAGAASRSRITLTRD